MVHPQPEPAQVEGGLTADTDSITELFSRQPDDWNESRMQRMISELRKLRANLLASPTGTKKVAAPKIAKADLQVKSGVDLLSALGLTKKPPA